jgi:hypothetical protein
MNALLFACLPIFPYADFDDKALPPIALEDLDAFHDARLALANGATCHAIQRLIAELADRWWDQAGRQHEYELYMEWLRWSEKCWDHLQYANQPGCGTDNRIRWLNILRRLIGPSNYYAGRMPDYPSDAIRFIERKPEPLPIPRLTDQGGDS